MGKINCYLRLFMGQIWGICGLDVAPDPMV